MHMPVRASELFEEHGSSLIGRTIMTLPMGNWIGGPAKIIDIYPNPSTKEILFQVQALFITPDMQDIADSEVGIFDDELVTLLDKGGDNLSIH